MTRDGVSPLTRRSLLKAVTELADADPALAASVECFPRHRAKAEAACGTALAVHGADVATQARAVTLRALEAGLDWTPGSA